MPPPNMSASRGKHQLIEADYSPLTSEDCFEEALEIDVPQAGGGSVTFRTYYTPARPKLELASIEEGAGEKKEEKNPNGTLFVMHHGAGYSALSFALMAKQVTKITDGEVGVLAVDCRGHGECLASICGLESNA